MGRDQFLGLLYFLFFLHSSLPLSSPLCPRDQLDALLQFKDSFALDGEASTNFCDRNAGVTSYPKTNSWSKGMDCCLWDGVTCDGITGNVIRLDLSCSWLRGTLHPNSSLFILRHIQSLNLAYNDFFGSGIWPNLSAFSKMTHLNLSGSHLMGTVPSEISHLSKLVSLDLSENSFFVSHSFSLSSLRLENSIFTMLVQNLTTIKKLVLDELDMSMVSPMSFANLSSSLTHLSIHSCSLGGIFPNTLFALPSLTTLDMGNNVNLSGILPKSNWTGPLVSLDLGFTSFSGELPNSIGNMKSLAILNLRGCKFTGHIPSSVADLKQLRVLSLGGNDFSGWVEFEISTNTKLEYTFPKLEVLGLSSCNLTKFPYFLNSTKKLIDLDLSLNRISGEVPRWFWEISHDTLVFLDLSHNLLEGGIQQLHGKQLSQIYLQNNSFQQFPILLSTSISFFDVSMNGFTSEIPSSICQLSSLHTLQLSNNSFFGNIPPCFGNITSLVYLDLSQNKLQGSLPRSLVKCRYLSVLDLGHNEFSDTFPHWLQAPLVSLDLQSNKFHGRINITAFELSFPSLESLFISNNNFIGLWSTKVFSNTSLAMIDLSNNKFGGPIPLPSPVTYYYSIANNNMTGKIPSLLCNATELLIIDLSNNSLTGSLPWCLTSFSTNLSALRLGMNYLEGTIPQSFPSGNSLKTLDLSRNQFEGTLPRSLVKCKNLEVLDLSDNLIEDTFPRWLGALPELKVLSLKSNNFEDRLSIPKGTHFFPKLRILDLSNNNFGGPLPASLIMNLKGMMNGENGKDRSLYMTWYSRTMPYENSVAVTIKGQEIELAKILSILTIIDLSCNSFQGDIPEVIGHLHSLIGLNLSHNHLTGSIPPTLGNLTDLGWLDLSSNKLSGEIPRVLGDLASLGLLNLSKNQLTGRIPQDKHLSTFSSDSFSGNPGLCGTPLPKACPGNDAQPPLPSSSSTSNYKGHERWSTQKAMWIGYASGIVIGISIAYIVFEMGRPKWLIRGARMLERRVVEWMEKPKRKAIK